MKPTRLTCLIAGVVAVFAVFLFSGWHEALFAATGLLVTGLCIEFALERLR